MTSCLSPLVSWGRITLESKSWLDGCFDSYQLNNAYMLSSILRMLQILVHLISLYSISIDIYVFL
jgi:hypothetical protein